MLEIKKNRFTSKKAAYERYRKRRTARRITVAAVVLLVLLIAGAVFYVWYMGKRPDETALSTPIDTTSAAPKIKTHTPPPDAPVGLVQQTFSGTVKSGSNAAISVKTNAGAACTITVKMSDRDKSQLKDSGLVPKVADEFGMVDWSWTVPKGVSSGSWLVEITCANESGRSGYLKADLIVEQ